MSGCEEHTGRDEEVQFQAKADCKDCYGRGFLLRTRPIPGRKKMVYMKTLCHCATKIKKPEPDKESIEAIPDREDM